MANARIRLINSIRHYATSLKVVGSILDEVILFFNWPNPSSRTIALGSNQPLTEMSTRNLGSLDVSQAYGPPWLLQE
jgi:hypothetical protein